MPNPQYDLQSYYFDDSGNPHVQKWRLLRAKQELISLCSWLDPEPKTKLNVRVAVSYKDMNDTRRGQNFKLMVCGSSNSLGILRDSKFQLDSVPIGMYLIESPDANRGQYLIICGNDSNIIVFSITQSGTVDRVKEHPFSEFQTFDAPIFCMDSTKIGSHVYIAAGLASGLLRISQKEGSKTNYVNFSFDDCVTVLRSFTDNNDQHYFLCISDQVYVIRIEDDLDKSNITEFPQSSTNDLRICGSASIVNNRTFILTGSYDGWVTIYEFGSEGSRIILEQDFQEPIYQVELLSHFGKVDLCVVTSTRFQILSCNFLNEDMGGGLFSNAFDTAEVLKSEMV